MKHDRDRAADLRAEREANRIIQQLMKSQLGGDAVFECIGVSRGRITTHQGRRDVFILEL
jgi:hypothetical protein